jgi:DNA repair protein RecO (recombination protein O)
MPPVIDEAICLRQWDYSETSQTCSLFTRSLGLVRALAKGSRRPKSPYSGGVEPLTRGRIGVIVRPQSELALLTEWDLAEMFPALRANLQVHHAGLYVADLIGHAIHDHDPHVALYDETLESLRLLQGPEDIGAAMLKFQWSVLLETGYRPVLDVDVQTGEEIGGAPWHMFIPSLGGLSSAAAAEGEEGASAWRVRTGTIELLRGLASGGLEGVASATEGEARDGKSVERANRLLASYLRYVLGSEPPTMGLVFGPRLSK